MKLQMTSQSRFLTPGILLGTIISATIVLTACADPTNCAPPPSGLVGWWRGDGDCLDAAGTNNGTLQGGATFALGEVGGAFSFNPVSGTMIVPDSSDLRLTNQLTIEAWINARSLGASDGYGLVSKVGGVPADGTQNFGYQFGVSGNTLFGQFSSPGDTWWQWPSASITGGLIAPGVWYHVAWTYDQSAMKLYCNGQPVATNVIGPRVISATSSNLRLSGDDNNHVYFDGLIDEAAVYNRALTDSEIQAIYNAGSAGKCVTPVAPSISLQPNNQVATVGANVSFSVVASGTAPLAYQWLFNGTNVDGAVTSTLTLTNVQDYEAGSYAVVVTNAYGTVTSSNSVLTVNPAPPCAPPPAGLIGWWPGEGTANDIVGANNGTLLNGVTFAPGNVGQAFAFNGANSYVQVSNNPNLNPTGSFSIEAWVYPRQDATAALVSKWGDTGELENQRSYNLFILPGRALQFAISDWAHQWDASFQIFNTPPGAITLQAWNYIVAVYDQSTGTRLIYVNGVQVASRTDAPITVTNGVAPLTLGAWVNGGSLVQSDFDGLLDEVSLYNRALSAGEIAAIYAAGVSGKCLTPSAPYIYAQPTNQVVTVGANVSFSVVASGTTPLAYQWQFNGTNVDGAVTSALTLTNVQFYDGGSYAVVVTNAYGAVTSTNAVLTVNPAPPCAPPPLGLVGWWRGEGDCLDQAAGNNGVLQNGATFASGEVGQAFTFDGVNDYVKIPRTPILDVGNQITIDFWMKADPSTPIGSRIEGLVGSDFFGMEISTAPAGVFLFISTDSGAHYKSTADANGQGAIFPVGEWHHVAGSYDGTNLQFYLDGQPYGNPSPASGVISPMSSSSFVTLGSEDGRTRSPSVIGTRYFSGLMDEVDIFNRALSATEIAAIYAAGVSGKCALPPSAPYIYAQPANQVATVGGTVTFSVAVGGTMPLSYQWSFGGTNIDGATNATLTLTNVQSSQAGNYSVVITNALGSASSSNATLTVNFPPALVRVVSVPNAQSGATVIVPVSLAANGNENGLSFSLNFDTTKLTYVSTALGSGASGANLLTNAAQAVSGRLGVILALPPNQTFAAGTQELVQVTFMAVVRTYASSTTVSFGDIPIVRELSDAPGNVLAATYASGLVMIQAATSFEGDLSPRPNGDMTVSVTDWVLAGRYAARLDYPTNAAEFQRADCAPRSTLGDGAITVIDWVQVGLYAAHLDPLTVAGGPTNEAPPGGGSVSKPGSTPVTPHGDQPFSRQLEVADTMVIQGLTGTASVQLESLGDENALGFSLSFDPAAMNYISASLGSAGNGVTMFVNDSQAGAGRLGFVLGLGTGGSFASGTRELVKVTFRAAAGAKGKCPVSFGDQPVPREVSSTNALPLAAGYVNSAITVNPLPSLSIGRSGEAITLAWPLWATNFGLQAAAGGLSPTVPWTNLVAVPTLTSNQAIVTLPLAATNVFYRLHQQ